MQYVMVLIKLESNVILVAVIQNHTLGGMVKTYQILGEYKEAIKNNNMKYQLVLPTTTVKILPKKPYRYSKIISSLSSAGQLLLFQ